MVKSRLNHNYINAELLSQRSLPYTVYSRDGRVTATVYAGRPAYVQVRYENASEGEVDAALLDMAAELPPLCCLVVLPQDWPL